MIIHTVQSLTLKKIDHQLITEERNDVMVQPRGVQPRGVQHKLWLLSLYLTP